MHWIPGRVAAFFRWLVSSERLPEAADKAEETGPRARTFTRWLVGGGELVSDPPADMREVQCQRFLSWVFSPEGLPTLPDEAHGEVTHPPDIWRVVFGGERLPQLDAVESRSTPGTGFLRWAFSAEVCPEDWSSSSHGPGGFLRRLLSPETCPEIPASVHRREEGFLRWLLSRETL